MRQTSASLAASGGAVLMQPRSIGKWMSIEIEAASLRSEIDAEARALSCTDRREQLNSAETLLASLRKRLDKPISHELKRRIVEALVDSIWADTVERWDVQQSQITVTYRFAEPNEAAPAVLPLSHHLTSRTRPPEKLETVGDHLRRRRLMLKLLQRQVAEQFGVNAATVRNWKPTSCSLNSVTCRRSSASWGYNPLPPPSSDGWGARLVSCRTALGNLAKGVGRATGSGSEHIGEVGARRAEARWSVPCARDAVSQYRRSRLGR